MHKFITAITLIALLAIALISSTPSAALEGYTPAEVECKTLVYQDTLVYGYEYIDDRGVVAEWTVPNDVAIVGSLVYMEVHPIGWPEYREGTVHGDTELSVTGGATDGTINKVDLQVVLGFEVPTKTWNGEWNWGNWVEQNVVMFPAGTAVIVDQGGKVSLVADGFVDIMRSQNGVAMYFRAYIWYIDLN